MARPVRGSRPRRPSLSFLHALLLVVAVVVAALWIVARLDPPPTPDEVAAAIAAVERPPRPPGGRARPPAAAEPAPAPPLDLDACDRDHDLHGEVVRRDGSPVASALVAAIEPPTMRTSASFPVPAREPREICRARTTAEGAFRLRLDAGACVALRVVAAGLINAERRDCQAGERVRIVLDEGVTLRVEAADEAGAPLPGIDIRIHNASWTEPWNVERELTTDAAGVAVADALPPGRALWVSLLTDGFADIGWHEVKLPGSGEATTRIVLGRGRLVRGRVTDDATGDPVPGARVGMGWTMGHAASCASDGSYALPGWTGKGARTLRAAAPGYIPSEVAPEGNSVDFALARGRAVLGRIVGSDGAPVPGALVAGLGQGGASGARRMARASGVAAADGTFRLDGIDATLGWDLLAESPGHGRVVRELAFPAEGDLDLGDVVLPAARTVRVRCTDERGTPLAGVRVAITGPDVTPARDPHTLRPGGESRRSDDLGRVRFPDLGPGRWDVQARLGDGAPVAATWTVAPDADLDAPDIVLPSRTLEVRIVAADGTPVGHAGVFLDTGAPGAAEVHRIAESGVARFAGVGRGAKVWAMVNAPLAAPSWQDVPDDASEFRIVVRRVRPMRVRVVDPEGRPVARAMVRMRWPDEAEMWPTTDASGEFATHVPDGVPVELDFQGVVDGTDSGLAAHADVAPAADEFVVLKSGRIATDRSLRARVVAPDDAPVAGVVVRVVPRVGGARPVAVSGADGRARFDGLAERATRVEALAHGQWAAAVRADVTPGGDEVVLRLRAGKEISGVLVTRGGSPVAGHVDVSRAVGNSGDRTTLAQTDAGPDGRFRVLVPADDPGPFSVSATTTVGAAGLSAFLQDARPGTELRVVLSARR